MRIEKLAWDTTVLDVLRLTEKYGHEQIQHGYFIGTYSRDASMQTLYAAWKSPRADVLLLRDSNPNNTLIGFAEVCYFSDHCVEKIGNIQSFYVDPIARGTLAGRILRDACIKWFDETGCSYSVTQDVAHIGKQGSFANLLKKEGYEVFGTALIRRHT